MSEAIYKQLAKVLDTLPNGFPPSESGVEMKLLKRIFSPDEAELFCKMRLSFETAEQVSQRTELSLEGLEEKLKEMGERGQLMAVEFEGIYLFKMLPWVFGIYEFQLKHMDRELAELCEQYSPVYGQQFFSKTPQMMYTLPIEEQIMSNQESLPYDRVSALVEQSQSFMVQECICKKEQGLLDNPCTKPLEVCMAFAPIPGIFKDSGVGRVITKEEAKSLLKKAEEAGLVHLTNNFQNGRFFICNCCGCCCGVLQGINKLGIPASTVIHSHYYAVIEPDLCSACGVCADERCQVKAIEEEADVYSVVPERCIGCGLCISTCPSEAIALVRKPEAEIVAPPVDETAWFDERAKNRGVDYSQYK
ncbi:MAG: 4Fe-4S binding protein [Proteobacteria bacterium]|nr:4Fe-4S binding protein [Pseudomonadota bacterium]MBU4472083.1 4Fe-4S binding protein [Pseudomonadota bacterium]MCG2752918.1 4Fe-4S binding protein [Desulfobacteraceae bacterium]